MRKFILLLFVLSGVICCSDTDSLPHDDHTDVSEFIYGADLSFLPQLESYNTRFFDAQGNEDDALSILAKAGMNTIRIRLWHSPESTSSSFNEVVNLANRAKGHGLKILLTVHYSDTWADPGKQEPPVLWQQASFEVLKDSIYSYTQRIVREINPEYIQIGNEINPGFLFPYGNRNTHPDQFVELLSVALSAVRDNNASTKSVIHFAGYENAISFFESLKQLPFDIMALSYYPWWHGKDLNALEHTMNVLYSTYNKRVLIAETAYPFTLGWNDMTHNHVGLNDQLIYPQYPATPQGQREFLLRIRDIVLNTSGLGFCYWGTELVAFDGPDSTKGSSFENLALFDFDNTLLPASDAFEFPE
jgi:arabinogalactan endo-1,4-beta-galactosidase